MDRKSLEKEEAFISWWIKNTSFEKFEAEFRNFSLAAGAAENRVGLTAQSFLIAAIAMGSIFSICLNLGLMVAKIKLVSARLTGFDLLVLNQLLINVLSIMLIDPWDLIAYMVLGSGWPFSERFCYFSRFCTTFLPYMSSWNIVLLTFHQLLAFFIERYWFKWNFYFTTRAKLLTLWLPPLIVWFVGLGIHAPITYLAWDISHSPGYCNIESLFALLHDGLGLFMFPFILGLVFLITMFTAKICTRRTFPSVEENSSCSVTSVAFQSGQYNSTGSNPNYDEHHIESVWNNGSDNEEQFDNGINDNDKDHLINISSPPPYNQMFNPTVYISPTMIPDQSSSPSTVTTPREITQETVAITCALLAGLIIFIGPYGILALMLDNEMRVLKNNGFSNLYWFFNIYFPWALAKPLFEPLAIIAVMAKYRFASLRRFWQGRAAETGAAAHNGAEYAGRAAANRSVNGSANRPATTAAMNGNGYRY
ncbi:hypothetical protein BV898_01621 [Hypsibius exemplaris]|uniref:G-protein coupled receptors family 1 profile domain-containing protein n=1 Tax=Hypsibius exemplaris TaxID=2072580 RepID=A0A1W0XB97_HYPEX|nr:hypothetical protein BV898_01621 [Hypsibius exemplaris]